MRKVLLAILCSMVLSAPAFAVENCFTCVLGLYGDLEMTQVTVTLPAGTPTDVYLGIKFSGTVFDGVTSAEFSIAGIGGGVIVAAFDPIVPATVLGSPAAPADTTSGTSGTGGCNVAWASCLQGSQALVKMSIVAFSQLNDKVFQIKRRYPTTNPTWQTPVITLCDGPAFTAVRIREACLVANPTSTPPACAIATEPATWGGVKELFR